MDLGREYLERVYAGVLGKIIGVYVGRPFEQWSREAIEARFGDILYYVHEKQGHRLIVADDDISGTFTFLRALEDHGFDPDLTSAQIGETWLNYIVENRTILWWGGLGQSSEHTAFLRLKGGIPAPESGSIALNGKIVAEQIGAQIFIDGWGLVCPGEPDRAVDLAARAARVSHDGEAVYGAQMVAAMVSLAFIESDIRRVIEQSLELIPADSTVAAVVRDVAEWRGTLPDWRDAQVRLVERYGYEKYLGGCHMVPNHAVVQLGLRYGDGDFSRSMTVVNTAGYDTDCNSGNVGCILGVLGGLAGLESGPDWRGPVADRMFLPTADGGSCMSDAATQAVRIAHYARRMRGLPAEEPAHRFDFSLPGAVQGFMASDEADSRGVVQVEGTGGGLRLRYHGLGQGRIARVGVATFPPAVDRSGGGYGLFACPALSPGQTVRALLEGLGQARARIYVQGESPDGDALTFASDWSSGESHSLAVQDPTAILVETGIEIQAPEASRLDGEAVLRWFDWNGEPHADFVRGKGDLCRQQWVNASHDAWGRPFQVVSNQGIGMEITGTREWRDVRVRASGRTTLAKRWGLMVRVQGLRRWYGLLADGTCVQLVRQVHGRETVLAEAPLVTEFGEILQFECSAQGPRLEGVVNGVRLGAEDGALECGGIALACDEGRAAFWDVGVRPA